MSGFTAVRVCFAATCGALLGGIALIDAAPANAQESDKLLAEVKAAWEKREATAKSVRLTWTMKNTTPKGAVTLIFPKSVTGETVQPPTDVTHEGKATILFDGIKTRYTTERMQWAQQSADFTHVRSDAVFNDGRSQVLHHYGNQKWPSGIINKASRAVGFDVVTWPALVAFRGTNAGVMNRIDLSVFTTARSITAEGRALVEINRPRTEQHGEMLLWLDPKQDYAVARFEIRNRTGATQQNTRVAQRRHSAGLWVPASWTVLVYDDQQLLRSVSATVTECAVNPPTTDSDFQLSFPPGTRVIDQSEGTSREYIVREDQPPREILPSEIGAPYDALARTETGELGSGSDTPGFFSRYWVWILGAVVAALLLAYGLRKRRQ